MRTRGIWGALALVVLAGCGGDDILPTPLPTPTLAPACQILVNGDNNGILVCNGDIRVTNPSPKPSPSPAFGPVDTVTINGQANGEHCPAGTPLANKTKTICHLGYLDITVNPRDEDGDVIFDTSITGTSPDSFREVGDSSAANFAVDGSNAFNGRITCVGTGEIVLKAVVKGVSSADETFTCQ